MHECFIHLFYICCVATRLASFVLSVCPASRSVKSEPQRMFLIPVDEILHVKGTTFSTRLFVTKKPKADLTFQCGVSSSTVLEDDVDQPCNRTSDDWTVSPESVTISDQMYTSPNALYVSRVRPYTKDRSTFEYIHLTCCQEEENVTDLSFSVSMVAIAYLSPQHALEFTKSSTKLLNPAFEDIAPCPCDLTPNTCDLHCCCDANCTSEDPAQLFDSCIPGSTGGRPYTPAYICNSTAFIKADYFPLMCVYFENNALLGKFYMEQETPLINNDIINERLQRSTNGNYYTYIDNPTTSHEGSFGTVQNYTYNKIVQTALPGDKNNTIQTEHMPFYIPQNTLTGECLDNAPIRFLKNVNSRCNYFVNQRTCTSNPVFSLANYPSSTKPTLDCRWYILQNSVSVAPSSVTYKCINHQKGKRHFVKKNSVKFLQNSSIVEGNYSGCQESEFRAIDKCSVPDTLLPEYNYTLNLCKYVVLKTHFIIKWRRGQIHHVQGEIVLGDVSTDSVITQNHVVEFRDQKGDEHLSQRSGRPGMQPGKRLLSGIKIPPKVDTTTTSRLKLISTESNGYCEYSDCQDIPFGYDATSSCIINLTQDDFVNCTDLRFALLDFLDQYMPSDVLHNLGEENNQTDSNLRWKPIYRQNVQQLFDPIPLIRHASDGGPSEIRRRKLEEDLNSWLNKNATAVHWCFSMPTGINVDVMYTMSGRAGGVPTYEILSGRINYTVVDMQYTCIHCPLDFTKKFVLSTSVHFIEVPPKPHEPVMRFYKDKDESLCKYETCWRDFLYPLSTSFRGDPRLYTVGLVSVIFIILVFYVYVTKPK